MKTIYIVRHAKSSWKEPVPDDQRPLLEKGKKRTKKIIDFLHEKDVSVDLILSSHAARALETARILAHALKYPKEKIMVDSRLYYSDGQAIFNHFYGLPGNVESVMLVGHNPALTDFVNHFLNNKIDNLPTSGVVCLVFDTDTWEDIPLVGGKVDFMAFPRDMK